MRASSSRGDGRAAAVAQPRTASRINRIARVVDENMTERQRVTGIGGIFFRARDAEGLSRWYAEKLGVPWKAGEGAIFPWDDPQGMTVWTAFAADSTYFGGPFMINFRVKDLDALLAQLAAEGVKIDPKRDDQSYGRFAWIYDPEGNKVELWQPL